jgi:hypothetical protein
VTKLKKKHRPMSLAEWAESSGAVLAVAKLDQDVVDRVLEAAVPEHREAFSSVSEAYHAYVCAHILNIMGKP